MLVKRVTKRYKTGRQSMHKNRYTQDIYHRLAEEATKKVAKKLKKVGKTKAGELCVNNVIVNPEDHKILNTYYESKDLKQEKETK